MKKLTITISESMYGELLFFARDHNCTKSQIIDALCFAAFWHNLNPLDYLIKKGIQNKK